MIKLLNSDNFDPTIDVGMRIVKSGNDLEKSASTIFGLDYDDLKPDDKSVGIHVVALGDYETYGINRNGDCFSKAACIQYHPTFVEHGHVFRHHRNKDPKKSIGTIKASAYNEPMGRIELFIHADKEKAAPELERLEKEGEIPFSMACKVPDDRCTICGAVRKHAGDDSECEHVKNHLGEQMDDGKKVGTFNDRPEFFDISFVGRPADRIAWNLKIASDIPLDSVKMAEYEGVVAPDDLAIDSASGLRKLAYAKELSSMHDRFRGWITKSASIVTVRDRYLYELRKIASSKLDNDTIGRLREYEPKTAFTSLGKAGVLMDVPTFFKYAMGEDFEKISSYIPSVERLVPYVIDEAVKTASCQTLCNTTLFDAYESDDHGYHLVKQDLMKKLEKQSSVDKPDLLIMEATKENKIPDFSIDTSMNFSLNSSIPIKLAEKYAEYKLSAIDAIVNSRRGETKADPSIIVAIAASQDLRI